MNLNKMVMQYNTNKQLIDKYTNDNKVLAQKIMERLADDNKKHFVVEDNNNTIKATVVESKKLSFNIEELRNRLNVKTFNAITDLNIEVDKAELKERFEKNPGLKKELGSALIMSRSLNETKLNKLIKDDVIDAKDLEGTYDVKVSKYLKVVNTTE